jgi:hypothetical protein
LVQATPIIFFFFAQLNDTQYYSTTAPNASYPVFNVAMSFISFFLTCIIPLVLMAYIYESFNSRELKINNAAQFNQLFIQILKMLPEHH